jgi:peptidoglycan hydrolase-like protein with peptidoglycan-binding domain
MDIRNILNTIDNISEGVFDNQEVADKNKQAQADLEKWQTDRKASQEAEINQIKALINQYAKLKGINYTVKESISRELIESFGYEYDDLLQEYSKEQFKSDAADFGRGVASGATLGYAPEIAAKIRSATGDISYEDALKQEIEKNNAAKKRSPWLYDAGSFAPSMAVGGPLGWGLAAADLAYGKDELANPFADDKAPTTTPDTKQTSTPVDNSAKPAATNDGNHIENQASPHDIVSELQTKLITAGFDVGPTGSDGKFGDKTVAALKQYTASKKLPSDLEAYVKLVGDAANDEVKAAVTEAEKIAALRKTLDALDEGWKTDAITGAVNAAKNFGRGITNKAAKGIPTTAAEKSASVLDTGKIAWNKPASAADMAAHGLGKGTRGAAIFGGKAAAKAAVLSGKAAVFGAGLAAKIGGKLAKFAGNHKIATILAGLALYGYTFNPEGNIVVSNDIAPETTPDIKPDTTPTQHGKPDISAPSNIPSNSEKPSEPTNPPGIGGNTPELSQLSSQIDWLIKYASTDTSPALAQELSSLKSQWDQLKK